ncbi:restriction endonuclease subunit S [Streptomyces sp. NPDC088141]|uniref:restriction endonuclease subunit S n=1 Tax=Streptomyces sp. NPDC088141 TaxID=3155179 RepID=UPI0034243708
MKGAFGNLPEHWQLTRVDRVASVNARIGWKALTAAEYQEEGYAFLATPNIKTAEIDFREVNFISEFRYEESPDLKLAVGDVLLAKDGNTLGIVNIVRDLPRPATVNGSIAVLRSHGIDPNFLRYVIASDITQSAICAVKDGMGVPHLFQRDINRLAVPLPPAGEQRRISDFLDGEVARVNQMIALRLRQLAVIAERYAAVMSTAVVGRSRSDKMNKEWPWLPADLELTRLGYFARIQSGVTVDASRGPTGRDVEVPYLRVANVQGERVDLAEVKTIRIPRDLADRATLREGDVVMTEANGNPDNLGRGAVWRGEFADMVHQNHVFAIRTDGKRLLPEYLSVLLASAHGRRYFRFTSNQVGIATTSSGKVLNMPIPVCSLERQAEVVATCMRAREATEDASAALNRQLALLAERRRALITAAVTGQIDVTTARGVRVP